MKVNGGTCPSLETIGAFVDGRLMDRERETIADHVASCEACYFVFSEAARTQVVAKAKSNLVSFPPRRITWQVAMSGLAAAAMILLAVNVWYPFGANGDQQALEQLVAAVGTARTFDARLTGGFEYAPIRAVRGVNDSADLSPDIRIAIAELKTICREARGRDRCDHRR
jgi:hypothetical protein